MEMFTRSRYDTALRMNSQNTRNQRTRLILAPVIAYSLPDARGKPLVATHFPRRVSDCRGDRYVIFSRSQCSWFSVHLLFSEFYDQNYSCCRTDGLAGVAAGGAGACSARPLLEKPAHRIHAGMAGGAGFLRSPGRGRCRGWPPPGT